MRLWALAAAFCVFLAGEALADHTTVIGGREYGTGLLPRPKDAPRTFYRPALQAADLPASYDSRAETDCIPAVRNQGSCGSCWAFATTGAHETAHCLAGHPLTDLAEQDPLVNDSSAYGCDGGFMDGAYLTEHGQATEAACPYRGSDRYSCRAESWGHATRWALLGARGRAPTTDELKQGIVQYGSLFVTVAAGSGFSPRNGEITTCGSSQVNHMVQLVAYRTNGDGSTSFLIKNSWGTSWGAQGYAWSKQGCNKLASTPGDAAGFFYVEPDAGPDGPVDPDEPDPIPAPLDLPLEVTVAKGHPVTLMPVHTKRGTVYEWSTGIKSYRLNLMTTTSVTVSLKATARDGSVTEQSVKVVVK